MENQLVSIIITNLNGRRWLKELFSSLSSQTYKNIEIIFVDGGSEDGSLKEARILLKKFKKSKLIIEKRPGWSLANNVGAKAATGKIFFFLSNDIKVDKVCTQEIVNFLNDHPRVAIVQCHSLSLWDKKILDSGMNFIDKFGFLYGFKPTKRPAKTFMTEGMAFAVKVEVYKKTKLDNAFIMEYDDVDFSWRVRLLGWEIVFLPSAKVYHARGGTVGTTYFERKLRNIKQYNKNHLVSLTRNLEFPQVIFSVSAVILIRILTSLFFTLKGRYNLAWANLYGLIWYLKELPKILNQRLKVQSTRKISDEELKIYLVPFNLSFLISWISSQKEGKRSFLSSKLLPKRILIN